MSKNSLEEKQETLSAEQFITAVTRDPAWAKSLTKPITIQGPVNLDKSQISHLSAFLTFKGQEEDHPKFCATFQDCPNLKIACGIFYGPVSFRGSTINRIQNLETKNPEANSTEKLPILFAGNCHYLRDIPPKGAYTLLCEPKKIEESRRRKRMEKIQEATKPIPQ